MVQKEELCLRLFLLRQNRYALAFTHQEKEVRRMMSVVSTIILEQRRKAILSPRDVYKKRTHQTYKGEKSFLPVLQHLNLENIHTEMLKPLKEYLTILNSVRVEKSKD